MSVPASCNVSAMDETELSALLGRTVVAVTHHANAGGGSVDRVTFAEGDQAIVKRAPDGWEDAVEKEAFVYRLLAEHAPGLPIPEVLAHPARDTLVLGVIEGNGTAGIETAELYRQIGALLAQLHAVHLDAFGYIGPNGVVEPHAANSDYMREQFARKVREHAEFGGEKELGARIAAYVEERFPLFDNCTTPSLCHSDCHEENLIARDGTIVALLDFQDAIAGDPLLDLARSINYSQLDRGSIAAALAEGWGPLPESWRDVVDLYILHHQLGLWNWFAYLGEREKLAPLEEELRQATRSTD